MKVWHALNLIGLIFLLAVGSLLFLAGLLLMHWPLAVFGFVVGCLALWGLLI